MSQSAMVGKLGYPTPCVRGAPPKVFFRAGYVPAGHGWGEKGLQTGKCQSSEKAPKTCTLSLRQQSPPRPGCTLSNLPFGDELFYLISTSQSRSWVTFSHISNERLLYRRLLLDTRS